MPDQSTHRVNPQAHKAPYVSAPDQKSDAYPAPTELNSFHSPPASAPTRSDLTPCQAVEREHSSRPQFPPQILMQVVARADIIMPARATRYLARVSYRLDCFNISSKNPPTSSRCANTIARSFANSSGWFRAVTQKSHRRHQASKGLTAIVPTSPHLGHV